MTYASGRFDSKAIGRRGERLAERFLLKHGYHTLARNWRWRKGEIDLIVEKDGELVFVEVKTRRSHRFGIPEEAITARKRHKLIQAAYAYLSSVGAEGVQWRIDVVAIDLDPQAQIERIDHIESAVDGS